MTRSRNIASPIIVPSCTFHRLARVVLSRKSFCCVCICGKRPMEWKRKRGRTGRSRMNELLKSAKKKNACVDRAQEMQWGRETLQRVHDHRTTSSSNEKWIENIVKHRVFYAIYACIYYISNDMWSNFVSRPRDFFSFSIFLVLKILALRTYVTTTVVWYNFHVHAERRIHGNVSMRIYRE